MRVIINADDLGFSKLTDHATFDAMEDDFITSATIMANGNNVLEAVKQSKEFSKCSFGIHLNLSNGHPLTNTDGITRLLDHEGCFCLDLTNKYPGRLGFCAAYEELCAQTNRLLQLGVKISHIDSHHHIHNLPWMFPLIKAIQKKYCIKKVRISQNLFTKHRPRALLIKKELYNRAIRHIYSTKTTAAFSDMQTYYRAAQKKDLEFPSIELMVHPGAASYQTETDLCCSCWWQDLKERPEYISFNDL